MARRFTYCVPLMEDRSGLLIYILFALMGDRSDPLIYLLCATNARQEWLVDLSSVCP